MFIRKRRYTLKNGTQCTGYGLVENRRVNGRPKQKTILNLGQNFDIPENQWPGLTKRVTAALRNQTVMPTEDTNMTQTVNDIVRRLRAKDYDVEAGRDDRDAIIIDQVDHLASRTVGGERVCLQALEQLGFPALLRELKMREEQVRLAMALVVGRMLAPGSEAHTYRWMRDASAILELVGVDTPSPSTLYRVGDALYERREPLQDGLYGNTQQLLGLRETLLLYDLTNAFYTGRKKGELLAYGRSKEKRSSSPLVTLALTLDGAGFVRRARVLPGNVSEPSTLEDAIKGLQDTRPTVIMDAGIATEANVAYLKAQGLDWICVQRKRTPPAPEGEPDECWTTHSGIRIKAWRMADQQQEARFYLQSAARKAVGDNLLNTRRAKFEAALTKLHEGLSKPNCVKEYDKVLRRLGREIERHKRVSFQYKVNVRRKKGTTRAAAVEFTHMSAFEQQTQASGGYILRTSHTGWTATEVARTYWRLADIEQTFRTMKSDLGLRPIFHSKDARIEAHIFLCVLAYHAVQWIRTRLKAQHIHSSWATLQFELNQWHRITTIMPKDRRTGILLKKDVNLGTFQRRIALVLGLKPQEYTCKTLTKRP